MRESVCKHVVTPFSGMHCNAARLLRVDVEGLDYDILRSNEWTRYYPEFVLVECTGCLTLQQVSSDPVAQLLAAQHYSMVATTMNTVLFQAPSPS